MGRAVAHFFIRSALFTKVPDDQIAKITFEDFEAEEKSDSWTYILKKNNQFLTRRKKKG